MGWLTDWRRKRVLSKHRIDDALWQQATGRLRFIRQTAKLRELSLLFLAEKQFVGARELEVSDAMRVSIAAQACLPVLELGLDWYAGFTGIVVYPGDFRVRRSEIDEHGVVHEWDDELAGEAMPGGPVVLSWDAAANDPQMNVVIHEFAHKLDMLSGAADGVPPLHVGMSRAAWLEGVRAKRTRASAMRWSGSVKPGSILTPRNIPRNSLPSSARRSSPTPARRGGAIRKCSTSYAFSTDRIRLTVPHDYRAPPYPVRTPYARGVPEALLRALL